MSLLASATTASAELSVTTASYLALADWVVIGFFFAFMAAMGWVFKRFVANTDDYFRAGGEMLWWVAGSSAFMTQFSAWTFTGAAGKAYLDGPVILAIFFGNTVGFLWNAAYFAPRFRQTRVITAMQAVRDRFGRFNEQFFTWIQLPLGVLGAGLWLNALSLFLATVLKFDLVWTIYVTGAVVLFMSMVGGAWAASASDFVQMLIVMLITVVAAVMSLAAVGGVGEFFRQTPAHFWNFGLVQNSGIVWLWVFSMFVKQFTTTNNLFDAARYLNAKDSRHARLAALLAAALFIVGPIMWFIPPMAARVIFPDLGVVFPGVPKVHETAYVAIAVHILPAGMLGLLVTGMISATMSSMDNGLNRNAGYFIESFYRPILVPRASERHVLWAGRVVTIVFGVLVIEAARFYTTLKDINLFDLMIRISSLIAVPILVPLIWGMLIRRAPQWVAWTTVLVGLLNSWLCNRFLTADWARGAFGLAPITGRNKEDWEQLVGVLLNIAVGSAWFLLASLFWRWRGAAEVRRVEDFFRRVETPVDYEAEQGAGSDNRQFRTMGGLCFAYGAFTAVLCLLPNTIGGRVAFVACGAVLAGVGVALRRVGRQRAGAQLSPGRPQTVVHEAVPAAARSNGEESG